MLNVSATSSLAPQPDGVWVPVLGITWDAISPDPGDLLGYEVEWQGAGEAWLTQMVGRTGNDTTALVTPPVIGGMDWDVRVRAYDVESKVGPWSDVFTITAVGDTVAPAVPESINAFPGYRLVGVRWQPGLNANDSTDADLSHYVVRYQYTDENGDPADATLETKSTRIVINDLEPGVAYTFDVAAVDRSGNQSLFSTAAIATPTNVGTADVAFSGVLAELVDADVITADLIEGGSLKVGGLGTDGIRIYDANGRPTGAWGDWGWLIADPSNPGHAIWASKGELKFTDEFDWDGSDPIEAGVDTTTWRAGIGPDGINAEAITFGAVAGGDNRVLNAGMELQAFRLAADTKSKTWTASADWSGGTNNVNMDVSGTELEMSAV